MSSGPSWLGSCNTTNHIWHRRADPIVLFGVVVYDAVHALKLYMDIAPIGLAYRGWRWINTVECCQVRKVPVTSQMLQCQAMQQACHMHHGFCKPTCPAPGLVVWGDVRRQSASIHHQGLEESKSSMTLPCAQSGRSQCGDERPACCQTVNA